MTHPDIIFPDDPIGPKPLIPKGYQNVPGNGIQDVPSIQEFISIINAATKTFRNPDSAVRHSRENARAMWRDPIIREPLEARLLATAALPWSLEPSNRKDPRQVAICTELTRIIDETPYFLQYRKNLLNAVFFGRWGIQNQFGWKNIGPNKRLTINHWEPVHGDTLEFFWGDNTVGLLVNPSFLGDGTKHLDTVPTDVTRAHKLTPEERRRFVIHFGEFSAGDFFEPEAAGYVRGVGLRTVVYWAWWLKTQALQWAMEYVERFGAGFTIYWYERNNAQSEAAVRLAAESVAQNNVIIWPRDKDDNRPPIERIEPGMGALENLMKLIDDYFGKLIKLQIVGQELTSEKGPTSLGGNLATVHESTFQRIVRYDAECLSDTLNRDFLPPLIEANFGELDFRIKFKIAITQPDPEAMMNAVKTFVEIAGPGSVDIDDIAQAIGITRPTQDSTVNTEPIEGEEPPTDQQAQAPEGEEVPVGGDIQQKTSNELRASVGGSQALLQLQTSVYKKELPREAAISNAMLLFGFNAQEANALFPDIELEQTPPPAGRSTPGEKPGKHSPAEAPEEEDKPRKFAWVTMGGSEEDGKKHVGGVHVDLDAEGRIVKGPAFALGHKPNELKGKKKAPAKEPEKPKSEPLHPETVKHIEKQIGENHPGMIGLIHKGEHYHTLPKDQKAHEKAGVKTDENGAFHHTELENNLRSLLKDKKNRVAVLDEVKDHEPKAPAPEPKPEEPKAPAVGSMTRAADFATTGTYNVQTASGPVKIYRDPESGGWYLDPSETGKHFSQNYIGNNKQEALAKVLDQYATPKAPASTATAPEKPKLSQPQLDRMRELRAKSDHFLEESRKLTPRGNEVAVGGAHMDGFIKGEALATYLGELNKGKTPDEALQAAKDEARAIVQNWNSKREYQVRRSPEMADTMLEQAHRSFLGADKATEEKPAQAPAHEPAKLPTRQELDALGVKDLKQAASDAGIDTAGKLPKQIRNELLEKIGEKPDTGPSFVDKQRADELRQQAANLPKFSAMAQKQASELRRQADQLDPAEAPASTEKAPEPETEPKAPEPTEKAPETKPEAPKLERTTPQPGTPEREDLKARIGKAHEEDDEFHRSERQLKNEIEKTSYGAKKRETLQKRLDKLREKHRAGDEEREKLKQQGYTAHLEDVAHTGDAANQLAAHGKLTKTENQAYDQIKNLAETEAERLGVTDPELKRSIGLSAASMIQSYPGNRSLADQVRIEVSHQTRATARREAEAQIDKLDLNQHDRATLRRQLEYAEPDQAKELVKEAQEKHKATKAAEAKAAAEKAATPSGFTKDLAATPIKGNTVQAQIKQAVEARHPFVGMAAKHGLYSNAHYLLKVPEKDQAKFKEADKPDADERFEQTRQKRIDDLAKFSNELIDKAKPRTEAAKPIAVKPGEGPKGVSEYVLDDGGKRVLVNAQHFATIQRQYPNATFHLDSGRNFDDKPIVVMNEGKRIGLLMPRKGEQPKDV